MNRRVTAVVDDMFFAAKIRTTAEHLGVSLSFARNSEAFLRSVGESRPDLIIVDLHSQKFDVIELARRLKSIEQVRSVPLLGFLSHVQTALKQQAEEAGYDRVLARSVFTKDLAGILMGAALQDDS